LQKERELGTETFEFACLSFLTPMAQVNPLPKCGPHLFRRSGL
jgi:hypothetical protein